MKEQDFLNALCGKDIQGNKVERQSFIKPLTDQNDEEEDINN